MDNKEISEKIHIINKAKCVYVWVDYLMVNLIVQEHEKHFLSLALSNQKLILVDFDYKKETGNLFIEFKPKTQ